MQRWRFVLFSGIMIALVGAAVATQITITPAPAQMAPPKVTGKVTDTVIKSFDASGLPGLHSIQYRRFVISPGGKLEGDINLTPDRADLCIARKGSITVTFPDGSKHTFRAGDIFTVPVNTKAKMVTVDAKVGFDERYWSINLKERK